MVIYDISFWEKEAGEGVYGWREKSTLQSLRNVKLSQQKFWHGQKNYLIKKAKKYPTTCKFQISCQPMLIKAYAGLYQSTFEGTKTRAEDIGYCW